MYRFDLLLFNKYIFYKQTSFFILRALIKLESMYNDINILVLINTLNIDKICHMMLKSGALLYDRVTKHK